jgi:hypothetical protein
MTNPWEEHARQFEKANNMTYMCAKTEAFKIYKKPKAPSKASPRDDRVSVLEAELEEIKKVLKYIRSIKCSSENIKGKASK